MLVELESRSKAMSRLWPRCRSGPPELGRGGLYQSRTGSNEVVSQDSTMVLALNR